MCARNDIKEYQLNVNGFSVTAAYRMTEVADVLDGILDSLSASYAKGERLIAFLAGPPGAGKSTLSMSIQARAAERTLPFTMRALGLDGFHLKKSELEKRFVERNGSRVCLKDIKGAPETFDADAFTDAVARAARKDACVWPVYDRTWHDVLETGIRVDEDVILMEGNWLLLNEEPWVKARRHASLTIGMYEERALLEERLIERKMRGGSSAEAALRWFERVDGPNIDRFYAMSCAADLRVERSGSGMLALKQEIGTPRTED